MLMSIKIQLLRGSKLPNLLYRTLMSLSWQKR